MESIQDKAIKFGESFANNLRERSKSSYRRNYEFLPKVLYANDLLIDIAYSKETRHYLFNFTRSFTRRMTRFTLRNKDVFNHFDRLNLWEEHNIEGSLGSVDDRTVIWDDMRNYFIVSSKPFKIQGKNNLMIIENLPLNLPIVGSTIIEFAVILSEDRLDYYINNPGVFEDLVYFSYLQNRPGSKISQHIRRLHTAKNEFSNLLEAKANELKFDQLFFKYPEILESAINLVPVESQIVLDDIHEQYNQDLRPDLLAFDELSHRYVIIDYKRSDANSLKQFRKVGLTFSAKIHDLIDQINLYCGYFNDFKQREHIKSKYAYEILSPKGIGIIGYLNSDEEIDAFNKCISALSSNIDLYTYSSIYEAFSSHIKKLEDFM